MSVEITNLNINVRVTSNQKKTKTKTSDVDEKRIIASVWEKCEEYINLITEQKMER